MEKALKNEYPKINSRWPKMVGICAIVTSLVTVILGLFVTPKDQTLGQTVRLLYVHPPLAWAAMYLAFGTTTISSLMWLWKRTRSMFWDHLAGASAEVGVLFLSLTLITGSIWGRTTWGVWWTWDARLTLTAVLLVLYLGYLAIRQVGGSSNQRASRSAVFALICAIDVPIVHFSVDWWNTLHQKASILTPQLNPKVHGLMGITLAISFAAATLIWIYLVRIRYEIILLEKYRDETYLDDLVEERKKEGILK